MGQTEPKGFPQIGASGKQALHLAKRDNDDGSRTCPQESLGDTATVMLDTDLNGTNGFSIIGPSEDAYAGSAVAGAGVRKVKTGGTFC